MEREKEAQKQQREERERGKARIAETQQLQTKDGVSEK